jgi:hypothetical protein
MRLQGKTAPVTSGSSTELATAGPFAAEGVVRSGRLLSSIIRWTAARLTFEAEFRSNVHQVSEGPRVHLSHHLAPVCLNRDLANAKLETDLLI